MNADRPPPEKKAEEFLKEEIKSARNGIGGLLITGLTVCRTLQVFSRVPGSSGLYITLAWLAGALVQTFFMFGHAQKHGRVDALPFEAMLTIQYLWWLVGVAVAVWSSRPPVGTSPLYQGRGICFGHWMRDDFSGVSSDIAVGLCLIAVLRVFRCPVLANWYGAILAWAVLCQLVLIAHELWICLRIRAANRRSATWNRQIRGRHYL